jgi:hypothetical protein
MAVWRKTDFGLLLPVLVASPPGAEDVESRAWGLEGATMIPRGEILEISILGEFF